MLHVNEDFLTNEDIYILATGYIPDSNKKILIYLDKINNKYMWHEYIRVMMPLTGCFASLAGCVADMQDQMEYDGHGKIALDFGD